MKTIQIIDFESYQELLQKIEQINQKLSSIQKSSMNESKWLTNSEVSKLLNVTPRTMQNYRDKGTIPFSQIVNKIYYKASDIDKHLEMHYVKALKERRA